MFNWLYTKDSDNEDETCNVSSNTEINDDSTKWVVSTRESLIFDGVYFNSQESACKYVQNYIIDTLRTTKNRYNIECYCLDSDEEILDYTQMDDVLTCIKNNDINIVCYKMYKRNNLFTSFFISELENVFTVQPIFECCN